MIPWWLVVAEHRRCALEPRDLKFDSFASFMQRESFNNQAENRPADLCHEPWQTSARRGAGRLPDCSMDGSRFANGARTCRMPHRE